MAAKVKIRILMFSLFCSTTMLSQLIFLVQICSIRGEDSTVFSENEGSGPVMSRTQDYGSSSIEDSMKYSGYGKKPLMETSDVKTDLEVNRIPVAHLHEVNSAVTTDSENSDAEEINLTSDSKSRSLNSMDNSDGLTTDSAQIDSENENTTLATAANISEPAGNSTNKTIQPFWSCAKYNTTQQSVIVLKDKNSLIWWLEELNKTMSCAVVLFYAKWCYFSVSLAPTYNAVGRAFSGIPILAIDAYNHNSLNTRYGIVGVPTIILFQESRPVARFNQTRTFKNLVEFIHQSTGMEYNSSVEVGEVDYEEGPLPSSPSEEFNFYLLASLCFLLSMAVFVLWRLQYVQVLVEYFMSFGVVRSALRRFAREKND